jgi:hypothetical protein
VLGYLESRRKRQQRRLLRGGKRNKKYQSRLLMQWALRRKLQQRSRHHFLKTVFSCAPANIVQGPLLYSHATNVRNLSRVGLRATGRAFLATVERRNENYARRDI